MDVEVFRSHALAILQCKERKTWSIVLPPLPMPTAAVCVDDNSSDVN
jgi:hypothetical protein